MGWNAVRKRALGLLGVMGLQSLLLGGCVPPPIDGQGYALIFQDQFEGTTVGATWATAPFGGSLPATVSGGILTLKTTAANDYRWGYLASTGPREDTEPNYPAAEAWRRGYFEARLRFTDSPWSWPAFWLFSMTKTEAWPGEDCSKLDAEWDVMENGLGNSAGTRPASSWYYTVLHRNTSDGSADGYCGIADEYRRVSHDFTGTDLSDWHIWSGRWTANELCTYLDGFEIQCMEPYDSTNQTMHMTFTMQYLAECAGCPARPSELSLQIDWVRVWQVR